MSNAIDVIGVGMTKSDETSPITGYRDARRLAAPRPKLRRG
jgi:hypothetical protein